MARGKAVKHQDSAMGAIEAGKSAVTELAEEMRNWYDGMPENLQSGSKGESVGEAADAIEGADMDSAFDSLDSAVDDVAESTEPGQQAPIPDIRDVKADWTEYAGKRMSRADRLSNALAAITAGASVLREKLDEVVEARKAREEAGEELEYDSRLDDLESALDEIDNAAAALEDVQFPGMYG